MKTLLVLIAATAFQLLALPLYRIGAASPDFIVIAVAWLALVAPPVELLVVALPLAGLLDAVSLEAPGTHVAALLVPIAVLAPSRDWFVARSPGLRWALIAPALLLAELARATAAALQGDAWHAGTALAVAAYSLVVAVAVFGLLDHTALELALARGGRSARRR